MDDLSEQRSRELTEATDEDFVKQERERWHKRWVLPGLVDIPLYAQRDDDYYHEATDHVLPEALDRIERLAAELKQAQAEIAELQEADSVRQSWLTAEPDMMSDEMKERMYRELSSGRRES